MSDQVFIRADLDKAAGVTTFYRIDSHLRDFLNKVLEKHGDIQAIILEKKEDGKYGFNLGFSIPKPKLEKSLPQTGHEEGSRLPVTP